MFRVVTRLLEIGPEVFMEYHVVMIFGILRFSHSPRYYVEEDSHIYPLRPTDVSRLHPWRQVPWLDRWGWTIPCVIGAAAFVEWSIAG